MKNQDEGIPIVYPPNSDDEQFTEKEWGKNEYRTVEPHPDEGGPWLTPLAQEIITKVYAMGTMGLPKVWIFEGDSGPEHYETCESLLDVLKDFGGKLIRLSSYEIEMINHDSVCEGRFLFQLD